ncbi:MAG TPA: hypothetical protein VD978_23935 [Azospirillum sp.]|nr:hypothetical protein [Azospirillum sp.]
MATEAMSADYDVEARSIARSVMPWRHSSDWTPGRLVTGSKGQADSTEGGALEAKADFRRCGLVRLQSPIRHPRRAMNARPVLWIAPGFAAD